jgi:1-phosphatidylinositol-4-phosphate 5-kinase
MGKSGAFFFFTEDKKFIIKTITSSEKEFLIEKVLSGLVHFLLNNPNSFLARIYGCFTV